MEKNIGVSIGIVGPYPPRIGGTAAFLSRLVPLLEQQGMNCQIFNTQQGKPGTGILERLGRFLFFIQIGWKVLISRCKIVHCHSVNWNNLIGHAIVILINRPFKKTVLTLHAGDLYSKISGKSTIPIAKFLLSLPNIITTVTPELKDAVIALGARQVFFIPNELSYVNEKQGPVPEYIQQFVADHQPLIVAVGAMEKVHGLDTLIRAIPLLKNSYPKLGVIVIAYKSINLLYKSEIDEIITTHHLQDHVSFPKELPDVQAVMKLADIFVRPTLSDGDSIAVREALALGIPVIASRAGFRPEGVLLFPPGNPCLLAEKIYDVLSSPKDRVTQLISSTKTVQEYIRIYFLDEK